ncbi:TPA: conjugal transfer protein TraD [Legionella pneumophila]|uniref:conjugal transfer protein TraD n=1 Tax=Legionella pneumophila TaxID=446 RepID=UPI000484C3B1|nr:conjugal transfer protein TraD [Legionella pneumophila]HAT9118338.1 conjugal transfer protein TraD [Legionella pneumophila subsp. pneumophila]MCH9094731.1 conjugal transfer protein TraD [Legionella pneumophila serogroup 1]MCH9136566.1 conjugal transfer protein TraD [Legionella pneumophila serogroup 1]MCH9139550.1 conjugal transfer protein TraD [Legionella pneumophila serogroup 1]MCH9166662.1 conjugal transfer protein TraD [Legionella pneumophila serogroup 1]
MTTDKQIEKEKQLLARCEKSLAVEKIKKRKADTRHKIELGGLVIKSGFGCYDKTVIFGALNYALELIHETENYRDLFETKGKCLLYDS